MDLFGVKLPYICYQLLEVGEGDYQGGFRDYQGGPRGTTRGGPGGLPGGAQGDNQGGPREAFKVQY